MKTLLLKLLSIYISKTRSVFTNKKKGFEKYNIGDWTYGKPDVYRYGCDTDLKIGKFCSIAAGVSIMLGGEHHFEWVTSYPFSQLFPEAKDYPGYPVSKGDVVIGNDVWIGRDAMILSGVTIGDGAVVAAKSLVAKDIPPFAVVGGVPAKILRYRFPSEQVDSLLEIRWWDWPIESVKECWPLLLSDNIQEFINKYGK